MLIHSSNYNHVTTDSNTPKETQESNEDNDISIHSSNNNHVTIESNISKETQDANHDTIFEQGSVEFLKNDVTQRQLELERQKYQQIIKHKDEEIESLKTKLNSVMTKTGVLPKNVNLQQEDIEKIAQLEKVIEQIRNYSKERENHQCKITNDLLDKLQVEKQLLFQERQQSKKSAQKYRLQINTLKEKIKQLKEENAILTCNVSKKNKKKRKNSKELVVGDQALSANHTKKRKKQ